MNKFEFLKLLTNFLSKFTINYHAFLLLYGMFFGMLFGSILCIILFLGSNLSGFGFVGLGAIFGQLMSLIFCRQKCIKHLIFALTIAIFGLFIASKWFILEIYFNWFLSIFG